LLAARPTAGRTGSANWSRADAGQFCDEISGFGCEKDEK
jgi:hypothetical protein